MFSVVNANGNIGSPRAVQKLTHTISRWLLFDGENGMRVHWSSVLAETGLARLTIRSIIVETTVQ